MFTWYGGLFLRGGSDDIQRVNILELTEFDVVAVVEFLLYAAEGAAPDYFVASVHFDDVAGGILFRLPNALVNVLNQLGFSMLP